MTFPKSRALDAVVVVLIALAMSARFAFDRTPGTTAAVDGFPLDDAWIHLVYARSLAGGHGFAYNAGDPEAGFTSPLWVVLLAPSFWLKSALGVPVVAYVKSLGAALFAATAVLGARLTARLSASRAAGLAAGVLLATEPGLAFASVSGMEVPLATTVLFVAALAALEGRHLLAAMALGLAPVVRPELVLVTGLFAPFVLYDAWASGRSRAAACLGAMVVPAATWSAYCLAITGNPLPTTFYAKHGTATLSDSFSDASNTVGALVADVPLLALGLGLVPCVLGAYVVVANAGSRRERGVRLAIVISPFLTLVGAIWAHRLMQPLSFYWSRYLLPSLPGFAVLVGAALGTWASTRATRPFARSLARAAISGSLLATLALTVPKVGERASLFAWNCQNIEEVQVTLGRWVARHVPPRAVVAVNDAGAIRYYGHRYTLDLVGLNAHRVLRDGVVAEIRRTHPSAFIVFPSWFPELVAGASLRTIHEARSPHYTICDCDQSRVVVLVPGRAATRPPASLPRP